MRWNRIDSWDQIKNTVTAGVGDDDALTVRPSNLTTIDNSMPPQGSVDHYFGRCVAGQKASGRGADRRT